MSVPDNLRATHSEKTKNAMKAPCSVKRITFNPSEANLGETLYVHVPKLNKNEVLVPGSLALRFDIDLSGGHANNFLVQNVTRALVSRMKVNFGGTTLEDTVDYNVYKTFQDLFLPGEKRDNMVQEGIQSEDLCKIRSGAGDAKTSGVDAEKTLNGIYGKKYRINLDHQILTDHGIFYLQALYNDLVFEVTLAPESQVVKGSDPTKLNYKLTNIQLEYEMIYSENLANEAESVYTSGKGFAYDHVSRPKVVLINRGTETKINIKVDSQRRSMTRDASELNTRMFWSSAKFSSYTKSIVPNPSFFQLAILAKIEMSTDQSKTEKTGKKRLQVSSSASEDIEEQIAITGLLERISLIEQQAIEREARITSLETQLANANSVIQELKKKNERLAKLN